MHVHTRVNIPKTPVRITNTAVKTVDDPVIPQMSLKVAVRRDVKQDKNVPNHDKTVPPLVALKYLL